MESSLIVTMNSISNTRNDSPVSVLWKSTKKITRSDVIDLELKELFSISFGCANWFVSSSQQVKSYVWKEKKNSDTKVRHFRSSSS